MKSFRRIETPEREQEKSKMATRLQREARQSW
jgi:hypothetical protein